MHHLRKGDYSASFKHGQLSREAAQVKRHRPVSPQDSPAPVKEELANAIRSCLIACRTAGPALLIFPLL